MTETVSYVTIGRLTRPHGIRGEICAQYYAQSLEYLESGQAFLKTEKSAPKPLKISSYKEQGNILIFKIKGINSRTEAEFLRNMDIVIEDSLLSYEDRIVSESSSAIEHDKNADFQDIDGEFFVTSASPQNQEIALGQAPFLHHLIGAKAYLCKTYILENHHPQKGKQKNEALYNDIKEQEPFLGYIEDIIFPADQEIWLIKTENEEEILFPAVSIFIDRYDLVDLTDVKVYINPPIGLLEIYMEDKTE